MAEKLDKKNDGLFPFQTYTFRNTTDLETMCPSAFDMMLNPEHEHELWIGNINGLVSPTSEYGLAIKLKGYIIAGKKLTFILPENYEATRPDNGNIGFRKTVLDMIRLGESRKQIIIRTYSIEHAEDDINKILKEFKETDMKFDVAIMNPPYDGNLHLKILEKVIPIAEKVVNISPVRWLQDPLAKYKKSSDYKRYEDTISKKIESLDVIDAEVSNNLFNIANFGALGIYKVGNGGYDYDTVAKDYLGNAYPICSKVLQCSDKISNHIQKGTAGICVKVATVRGFGSGKNFDIVSLIHSEPYIDGNGYKDKKFKKKDVMTKDVEGELFVRVNSVEEGRNFINSTRTLFHHFLIKCWKIDQNVPLKFLPYMQDYTQPWDDKRFCEYFGITGYIDDDHAEPGSEWETILKTMEQYK